MSAARRSLSKAFTGTPHVLALPAAWPAPFLVPDFHGEARLRSSLQAPPPQGYLRSAAHTSASQARQSHVLARVQIIGILQDVTSVHSHLRSSKNWFAAQLVLLRPE